MPDSLGHTLREARRDSGLSFRKFAQLVGFSESHLRSVENGHRAVTTDIASVYDRVLATGGAFVLALAAEAPEVGGPVPWDQPGTWRHCPGC